MSGVRCQETRPGDLVLRDPFDDLKDNIWTKLYYIRSFLPYLIILDTLDHFGSFLHFIPNVTTLDKIKQFFAILDN